MKKNLYIFSFFLLIGILLANDADAQRRRRRRSSYRRRGGSSITLHNFSFNAGFYKPGMDYWNDESYLAEEGKSFDGGMLYQLGLDLDVYNGLLLGFYGAYFSDNVESYSNIGAIERTSDLSYKLIPLSLQLKYELTLGDPRSRYRNTGIAKLHPYLGVGLNYTIISQQLKRDFTDPSREDVNESQQGATVTYSGIVGLKYDITRTFGIGAEMNYYLGSFDQQISSEAAGDNVVESISLNGPCFSGKLYLKVPSGRRPGYRRPRRR